MLVFLLPILQALSCLCTIWGVAHTSETANAVVTYGAADTTSMEWMNSVGSIVIGIGGFVVTHFWKQKVSSELLLAVVGELHSPRDPAALRRLAFALLDWLHDKYATQASNSENGKWWADVLASMRTLIAQEPPVPPTKT